jgi:hypothetical protein
MKKFLPFVLLIIGCVALPVIDWWWHQPHNPPPAVTGNLWPSCHWEGSQDQNNWIVVFQIDDLKHHKNVWKQQVETGVSEQAADTLCDAYVKLDMERRNGR